MKEKRASNIKEERRTEEEEESRRRRWWRWGFGLDLSSAKDVTDWILLACIFEQRHPVLRHLAANL